MVDVINAGNTLNAFQKVEATIGHGDADPVRWAVGESGLVMFSSPLAGGDQTCVACNGRIIDKGAYALNMG